MSARLDGGVMIQDAATVTLTEAERNVYRGPNLRYSTEKRADLIEALLQQKRAQHTQAHIERQKAEKEDTSGMETFQAPLLFMLYSGTRNAEILAIILGDMRARYERVSKADAEGGESETELDQKLRF